jgi:hypothetical protein
MKNKSLLFITFLITPLIHMAQSLTPFVISTSGGSYSNASGQLSFTTGEMSMVKTFTAGGSILTQGFQQSFDFGVYVNDIEDSGFLFNTFPNPNNGKFTLYINSKSSTSTLLSIFDAIGKEILRKELEVDAGSQIFQIQLPSFSEGIYFLELLTDQNKLSRRIQIIQ